MTDFLQHKASRSFAQSFTEFFCGLLKNLALFVFFYTEIHRIFFWFWLRWLETHRDILLFPLRTLRKNFALFAFKFTQSYTEHFWFWLRWKELHRDDSLSSWRSLRKTFASLRLNLHRATPSFFLILIVLKRDPPRRLTFFLARFAKNLCLFAFKSTHYLNLNLSLVFALVIDNVSLN